MNPQVVIMDIDGTLANADHRLHHIRGMTSEEAEQKAEGWRAFLAAAEHDSVNDEIRFLNNVLHEHALVFIVTGRNENDRAMTLAWLAQHGILYDRIYMRRADDRRPDTEVKREVLEQIRAEGFKVQFAVEDRASVTAMWRAEGLRCLQVCDGKY
jgi:phosphoglycolate phosphatase-like HAD superfamily hydrolase